MKLLEAADGALTTFGARGPTRSSTDRTSSSTSSLDLARSALVSQAEALVRMADRLDDEFLQALELIENTSGRVVVAGLGKSGLIGKKAAATLASTGTPAFFMHASDALHGDLGMIDDGDVVILLSYSGETDEVVALQHVLLQRSIPTIAVVGRAGSTLGRLATVTLLVTVERETCPLDLAPTTSTLTTLAMCDALAVSLMARSGFQPADFARNHPGGSLGRQLRDQSQIHRKG